MTEADLLRELSCVMDPDLGRSIVDLGMIKEYALTGDTLAFTCELTTPACPVKEQIENEIRRVVREKFPEIKTLDLKMTGKVRNALGLSDSDAANFVPQIKNVILIASGKGGVGKSVLALNLALALHATGAKTALLDLDLHAPTLPVLLHRQERPKIQSDQQIQPLTDHGLEVMSMGFLVEPRQPMLWRGQIIQGLVNQFLKDVTWSERDYLLIDLPTGASDVLLAVTHCCPVAGAVLVTTPDELSRNAIWRAQALLEQTRVPILGLLENLSTRTEPDSLSNEMKIPWLGGIPYEPTLSTVATVDELLILKNPAHPAAQAVKNAAERIAAQISIRNATPKV